MLHWETIACGAWQPRRNDMKRSEILRRLRSFNETAEELAATTFVQRVLFEDTGIGVRHQKGKPLKVERRGPDEESIKAFVARGWW